MGTEVIKKLKQLIEEYEAMLNRLIWAKYHIKKRIECFPPEDLECMAMDGIIDYEDIPEKLRTDYVKSIIKDRQVKQHDLAAKDR